MIRQCIVCGVEFEKTRNKKTCGPECRRENTRRYMHDFCRQPEHQAKELERSRRRQEGRKPTKAACVVCGAEFIKLRGNKTCGTQCSAQLKKSCQRERDKRRTRTIPIIARCVICGSEFRKLGPGMTCGLECRAQLDRSRERTYRLIPEAREKEQQRRRRFRETNRIVIPCAACGKPFTKLNRSPCCSLECREQHLEHRRSSRSRRGGDEGIAPFPDGIDREAFGYWLSGFADGEGSFMLNLVKARSGQFHPRAVFRITLRDDDAEALRLIHSYWRCGTLHFNNNSRSPIIDAKPVVSLCVSSSSELVGIVIPHFERYPLRAKKRRDFEVWRHGVELLAEVHARPLKYRPGHCPNRHGGTYPKWTDADRERFITIREELRNLRRYLDGWLATASAPQSDADAETMRS